MNQPDKKFKTFANSPKTNHNDTFRDTSHRYSHDYEKYPLLLHPAIHLNSICPPPSPRRASATTKPLAIRTKHPG